MFDVLSLDIEFSGGRRSNTIQIKDQEINPFFFQHGINKILKSTDRSLTVRKLESMDLSSVIGH